jgi:hypothetical protein
MSKRTTPLLLLVALATSTLWAANDPFVGEWRLNPSKSSTFADLMKVERVRGDKYAFDFGGGPETIDADGTDQPGGRGTVLSATIEAPDSWKIIRKKDGHLLLSANWKLSKDGQTLSDEFTSFAPDGSASTENYLYKRTARKSGFAGTWENTTRTMLPAFVMDVRPYEGDGLSFIVQGITKNVKFDGKDYPNGGPNSSTGSTSSARRVSQHTLERIDKLNGNVRDTREISLSSDGKTLTMTIHTAGQSEPTILVFERQ